MYFQQVSAPASPVFFPHRATLCPAPLRTPVPVSTAGPKTDNYCRDVQEKNEKKRKSELLIILILIIVYYIIVGVEKEGRTFDWSVGVTWTGSTRNSRYVEVCWPWAVGALGGEHHRFGIARPDQLGTGPMAVDYTHTHTKKNSEERVRNVIINIKTKSGHMNTYLHAVFTIILGRSDRWHHW